MADDNGKEIKMEDGKEKEMEVNGEENATGKTEEDKDKDGDISTGSPSHPMAVARDLAKALVQIEKGIEHRFLLPPFGKNLKLL